MSRKTAVAILLIAASVMLVAQNNYEKQILLERQGTQKEMQDDMGPLYVIGRYHVREGRITLGSASGSTVVLPKNAPALLGTIERRAETVTFEAAGSVPVFVDGKKIEGVTTLRTKNEVDKLLSGDFSFSVQSGQSGMILLVRDRQSPYAKSFHGLLWFPVNSTYKLEATFTPYADAKSARVPDTQGGTREMRVPGFLAFALEGKTLRLDVFANSPDYLFLMFKDGTSGKETYGGGRYLQIDPPKNGKAVVDFNRAYNPICAVSPFFSCPIVPSQSILPVRVEAGEKYRASH